MARGLSAKHFHDEDEAFAYVEARVWPEGPTCPHCGGVERISKMQGKSTRKGLYKCYQCRKPFTVRMGTIFESSKVALHIWLQAMYLIAGSKKGVSSNQLARTLGLTVKTAWFLSHRIREAMREGGFAPFGADGGAVEVDETYIGRKAGRDVPKGGWGHNVTTNTIEGAFSIFKRGMRGVYQHCAEKHLHRYLAEFEFRYSHREATGCDDEDRAARILRGIVGKRLTYQTTAARA